MIIVACPRRTRLSRRERRAYNASAGALRTIFVPASGESKEQ